MPASQILSTKSTLYFGFLENFPLKGGSEPAAAASQARSTATGLGFTEESGDCGMTRAWKL